MTVAALSGSAQCAATPERVARALRDPLVLQRLIPGCTDLKPAGLGRWTALVEREAGPVTIRLKARIALSESAPDTIRIDADGGSLLAGRVELAVTIRLDAKGSDTLITHHGTLRATGLAGRLLAGNEPALMARVKRMFEMLARQIEAEAA